MTNHDDAGATPHRYAVDLSPLEGQQVLGESLAVLFSFALRLRFEPEGDDMMSSRATCPQDEAHAVMRAMERVEPAAIGDQRTQDQRNADRFVAVLFEVLAAADEVLRHLPKAS